MPGKEEGRGCRGSLVESPELVPLNWEVWAVQSCLLSPQKARG